MLTQGSGVLGLAIPTHFQLKPVYIQWKLPTDGPLWLSGSGHPRRGARAQTRRPDNSSACAPGIEPEIHRAGPEFAS
jgi:hypothetical protein